MGCSPFEALYGFKPTLWMEGPVADSAVVGVHEMIRDKQAAQHLLKKALEAAQARMKLFVGKKRVERVFQVGDWV